MDVPKCTWKQADWIMSLTLFITLKLLHFLILLHFMMLLIYWSDLLMWFTDQHIQLRKLLSRIRNQEWKLENPGEGKYYGSNVWYGGKLGEEEEDPDWEHPRESGSRKRKRSHITDWDGATSFSFIMTLFINHNLRVNNWKFNEPCR